MMMHLLFSVQIFYYVQYVKGFSLYYSPLSPLSAVFFLSCIYCRVCVESVD